MRNFALLVSARARQEMLKATWWRLENLGPDRAREFANELAEAFDRLQAFPEIGPPARLRGGPKDARVVRLARSGYRVYYRAHLATAVIEILAIWHGKRRSARL